MPLDQPLPNVRSSITPPASDTVDTWTLAWTAVRFRARGTWKIGVVRGKIRLKSGEWLLEIEYAFDGTKAGWHEKLWAAWDPRLIVPIETEPPSAAGE